MMNPEIGSATESPFARATPILEPTAPSVEAPSVRDSAAANSEPTTDKRTLQFPVTSPVERIGRSPKTNQRLLAEWSGHVTAVGEYFFSATLHGVRGEGVTGVAED